MALTASSTASDILAAYIINCDYEFNPLGGSVSKCQSFIQACAVLLATMPKMTAQDRASTTLSPDLINDQLTRARRWMYQQPGVPGGGGNRYFNTENYRPGPSQPGIISNPDPGGTP